VAETTPSVTEVRKVFDQIARIVGEGPALNPLSPDPLGATMSG
jgi:hypothetical protein